MIHVFASVLILGMPSTGVGATGRVERGIKTVCVSAIRKEMPALRASPSTDMDISGIFANRLSQRYAAAKKGDHPPVFVPDTVHADARCKSANGTAFLEVVYEPLAQGQPYKMRYTAIAGGRSKSGEIKRDLLAVVGDAIRLPLNPLWHELDRDTTSNCDVVAAALIKMGV